MNTEITITVKDLLLFLLGAGGIVLIVFLIVLTAHLIKAVKNTTQVLSEVETITRIAEKRTEEVDGLLDNVIDAVSGIAKNLKGNVNLA
ncbi:MAG: hypothetical protein LBD12_07455, partial [Clostridiales Family XIII bacterium]|nr:hypothetical protein [Clostridiales Family XIII bacterium]